MTEKGRKLDFEGTISWFVAIGIAALLILSPLACWRQDPYGLIKNVVVEVGAFTLAAVWLCTAVMSGEIRWRRSPITLPLFAILAWACLCWAITPLKAYGGARLRELFAYLLLYLLALNYLSGDRQKRIVLTGALIGMFAVSLTGIAQYIQLLPTDWADSPWSSGLGNRVYGTMLNPNILAGQIIALFSLGLSFFLFSWKGTKRLLGGILLAASFACLLLTVSWGGYAAFLAGVIFLLFCTGGRRNQILPGNGPIRLAVLLSCMAILFFSIQGKSIVADTSGMRARFIIWRASVETIREHPVMGHGPGNTPVALGEPLTKQIMTTYRKNPSRVPWSGSYRIRFLDGDYFGLAVEFGLVGLALTVWLFVAVFRKTARALRERPTGVTLCAILGAGGCAVSLLVQSTVSYPFRVMPTAAAFFALLGIAALAGGHGERRLSFSGIGYAPRAVLSVMLAALFLIPCLLSMATMRGEKLLVQAFNLACQGRWMEAAEKCEAASRYPVTDPEAYNIWGDAMLKINRPGNAEAAFIRLLQLSPSRPDTYDKLGMIYERRGDNKAAFRCYKRAVELERHDTPQFRLHLTQFLEK